MVVKKYETVPYNILRISYYLLQGPTMYTHKLFLFMFMFTRVMSCPCPGCGEVEMGKGDGGGSGGGRGGIRTWGILQVEDNQTRGKRT
jgi:hypothetical protein